MKLITGSPVGGRRVQAGCEPAAAPIARGAVMVGGVTKGEAVEYYEDISLEVMRDHGPGRVVTAEEIKRFASEFDPMPFHLDEEAARASVLGGLCASSVHVLALGSQLAHESQGGEGEMAVISGLGWDEVRLRSPLYAGDHIRAQSCVESKRESGSRPDCGIVTMRNEILRADGGIIATYKISVLVEKRPKR